MTQNHRATLESFEKWVRKTLGATRFSALPESEGEQGFYINHGKTEIRIMFDGAFCVLDKSQGTTIVVIVSKESLEEVLLHALTWDIRNQFIDTYQA